MKTFSIEITESATRDIQSAFDWYFSISEALGNRFEADLNRGFKSLSINPYFQIRYRFYRCIRLKNFPYLIHFMVHEKSNVVKVAAVLHTAVNPESWPSSQDI